MGDFMYQFFLIIFYSITLCMPSSSNAYTYTVHNGTEKSLWVYPNVSGQGKSRAAHIPVGQSHTFAFTDWHNKGLCLTEIKYTQSNPTKDTKWQTMRFSLGTDIAYAQVNKKAQKDIADGAAGGAAVGLIAGMPAGIAITGIAGGGGAIAALALSPALAGAVAAAGALAGAAVVAGGVLGGMALAYLCRDWTGDSGILLYQKTDNSLRWTLTKQPTLWYMTQQAQRGTALKIGDTKKTSTYTFYNITGQSVWIEPQLGKKKEKRQIAHNATITITVKENECLTAMKYKFQQAKKDKKNTQGWQSCDVHYGTDLLEQKRISQAPALALADGSPFSAIGLICGDQHVVIYNSGGKISWTVVTAEDAQKLIAPQ